VVNSPELWELLVAPVRSEVGEALRLFGPCSVAEVAAALDRPADTLYRHIEALREAGFVRETGFRKNGRHTEQLFDVVADDFVVEFKDNAGKGVGAEGRAIVQTAESFAKTIVKAVKASAIAGELEFEERARNISINYELSWLTHEQYQQVRAIIRRLKEIMDDGKRRREGRLYMTLAIATPVTRKRGAVARSAAKPKPRPTADGDSRAARSAPRRARGAR
jgi:DNA-binding transcriptional ArsR family regulator